MHLFSNKVMFWSAEGQDAYISILKGYNSTYNSRCSYITQGWVFLDAQSD